LVARQRRTSAWYTFSLNLPLSCNNGGSFVNTTLGRMMVQILMAVRRYALRAQMKESVRRPDQSITQLLVKWGTGDKTALDDLIPLVYDELRKLAAGYLRRRSGPNTLQATALVHEAYVRLADQSSVSMEHRAQFFGLAAKVMRDILVDHARTRLAAKRGGEQIRLSLTEAERFGRKPEVELVALDDALKVLAATNPQHSRVIELRFFGGLTIEETSQVMNLSHATTERYWSFARAWLRRELGA
jgi:RNA polymerase sigma factor (TIGR02999 family)